MCPPQGCAGKVHFDESDLFGIEQLPQHRGDLHAVVGRRLREQRVLVELLPRRVDALRVAGRVGVAGRAIQLELFAQFVEVDHHPFAGLRAQQTLAQCEQHDRVHECQTLGAQHRGGIGIAGLGGAGERQLVLVIDDEIEEHVGESGPEEALVPDHRTPHLGMLGRGDERALE